MDIQIKNEFVPLSYIMYKKKKKSHSKYTTLRNLQYVRARVVAPVICQFNSPLLPYKSRQVLKGDGRQIHTLPKSIPICSCDATCDIFVRVDKLALW